MKENDGRLYLLREEKVSKALIKLGIPTMIGMMVSALYNLVDVFFVSQLGTAQMGAVAVVFPLGVIFLGIGLLFGSGASSYLSRLLGEKQYKEANECASTAVATSMGTSVILILLLLCFLNPVLKILGVTSTMFPYAKEYASIFVLGLIFNVFNITINNIITAEGAAMVSMMSMLVGGITNMVLDPLLIYTCNMGIRGAAIATLISRCISSGLYLFYLLSGKSIFKFSIKNFAPSKTVYLEIFKIGTTMLIFQLLISVTLGITNVVAASYGDSAVAAIGAVSRIMSLGNMAIFGFLKGYQPFVGYNFGAGEKERINDATKFVLTVTTVFGVIVAAILIVFSTPIMQAFSKNDLIVVSIGRKALILNAITFITLGFQAVYATMFLALGNAKEGGLISIGRQGAFFIPLVFLLSATWGLNGLIIAQPIADVCSVILVLILIMKFNKAINGEMI